MSDLNLNHKAESTSPGTLFPVTFRMVPILEITSYNAPLLPGGQPKLIYSSTDSKVECHQEPGGPYSCLASSSFFLLHVTYSFQVAAQNSFGAGSFSTPVHSVYSPQGST